MASDDAPRDDLPDYANFIREMYAAAEFESWAAFAREANVLPSSISDWKDARNAPEGPNFMKLVRAVQRTRPEAFNEALEKRPPLDVARELQAIRARLENTLMGFRPHTGHLGEREREVLRGWAEAAMGIAPWAEVLDRLGFESEDDLSVAAVEALVTVFSDDRNVNEWKWMDGFMRSAIEAAQVRQAGGKAGAEEIAAHVGLPRRDRDEARVVAAEVVRQIREQLLPDLDDVRDRVARLEEAAAPVGADQPEVADG